MLLSLVGLALVYQNGSPTLRMPGKGYVCPVSGEALEGAPAALIDFSGVRYSTCCHDCEAFLKSDAAKALASDKLKGKLLGYSLFDPVTGLRIDAKKSEATTDYSGVRYYFAEAKEKDAFLASPKRFTAKPEVETLVCPNSGEKIDGYASAGGYVEIGAKRLYVCCSDCFAAIKNNPSAFLDKAAKNLRKPVAMNGRP